MTSPDLEKNRLKSTSKRLGQQMKKYKLEKSRQIQIQNLISWRWSLPLPTYKPSLVKTDALNFELSW